MNAHELPQLAQFFGGWFHQDWTDEGSDLPGDVVRRYAREETPRTVRSTMEEIDRLLASRLPPAQMRRLMVDELGCAYDPTLEGKTFRAWLREVRKLLRMPQAKK
jgi:hypothetical protein